MLDGFRHGTRESGNNKTGGGVVLVEKPSNEVLAS